MGGVVPLSEHEQRQLEQIEQALYREDPKFGRLVRSSDPRVHYKRKLVQALVGVIVGAGLLAAARGQGPPRQAPARQGEGEGAGPARSRPSATVQARPDDGADGRAVASPARGRPQDVTSPLPRRAEIPGCPLGYPAGLCWLWWRGLSAVAWSGMRAAAWVRAVIMEAGKMVARQRVERRAVAASPRRAVVASRRRCCDAAGRAA